MGKGDIEMEDAEKHDLDPGSNIEESKSELPDAVTETKKVNFSTDATVAGDANKSESQGEDLNDTRDEAKEKTYIEREMVDQMDPESETNEPKSTGGSSGEKINTKSKNEELLSNTITTVEEQTAARNPLEKQTDANSEIVDQNTTNVGVDQEMSTVNGVEDHYKQVAEKPIEDDGERKVEESGREDRDYVEHAAVEEMKKENAVAGNDSHENKQFPTNLSSNKVPQCQNAAMDKAPSDEHREMEEASNMNENTVKDEPKELGKEVNLASHTIDDNAKTVGTAVKHEGNGSTHPNQHEAATANALVRYSPAKAGEHSGETVKSVFTQATLPTMLGDDSGTPEEQAAFMKELETFCRERSMDFKPPKFYGQPLNCLKLWRAVLRLGGYDRVTGSKLWRQVGESFHPPKTCTTVSWTFRIFYEKSLLEYERHKTQSGELQLAVPALPEASGIENEAYGYQGSASGRARRDAAARAMQGWHVQRLFGNDEDKNPNNMAKREKYVKSSGSLKQKRPNEGEHSAAKVPKTEASKQLATSIVDVGPPADWVKINVRQTKDCFEVYALVPGLLREEVRVQSDPAGRLVITGQPEQVDNPWGITAFKKVVSLPARIDPLQTSAVVSLHGRLFVRIPFEQPNAQLP